MKLDQLADGLSKILPPELGLEIQSSVSSTIARQMDSMGVVSREQFDVQKRVLQKTRAKLVELEKQVLALENQ